VDCVYHLEPSWEETVARYQVAHRLRDDDVHQAAWTDMLYVAFFTGLGVLCFFLITTIAIFVFGEKEMGQLHNYIMDHKQDSDHVDEASGATAKLDAKTAATDRVGVGQETDGDLEDFQAQRVEGRFATVSHVQEAMKKETKEDRKAKKKLHDGHVKSMIERAFEAIDVDGSGELNREELKQLLKQMGEAHGEEEMDKVMLKFDPDGSGSVTFTEFRDGWHADQMLAKSTRKKVGDGDGQGDRVVEASTKKTKRDRKKQKGQIEPEDVIAKIQET